MYYVISDKMIDLPTGIELFENSEKKPFLEITPQKIEDKSLLTDILIKLCTTSLTHIIFNQNGLLSINIKEFVAEILSGKVLAMLKIDKVVTLKLSSVNFDDRLVSFLENLAVLTPPPFEYRDEEYSVKDQGKIEREFFVYEDEIRVTFILRGPKFGLSIADIEPPRFQPLNSSKLIGHALDLVSRFVEGLEVKVKCHYKNRESDIKSVKKEIDTALLKFVNSCHRISSLDLSLTRFSTESIVQLLSKYKLKGLTLDGISVDLNRIFDQIEIDKSLISLSFKNLDIKPFVERTSRFIENYPLEKLAFHTVFEMCDKGTLDTEPIFKAIQQNTMLKQLKMSQDPNYWGDDIAAPSIDEIEYLVGHPSIERLQLWNTNRLLVEPDEDLGKVLASLIKKNKKLISLQYGLAMNDGTDESDYDKSYFESIYDIAVMSMMALRKNFRLKEYNYYGISGIAEQKIVKYLERNRILGSEIFALLYINKRLDIFPKMLIRYCIAPWLGEEEKIKWKCRY